MTSDDVMRMAWDAELYLESGERMSAVERFAALVADAERRICAQKMAELERQVAELKERWRRS